MKRSLSILALTPGLIPTAASAHPGHALATGSDPLAIAILAAFGLVVASRLPKALGLVARRG